MVINSKDIAKLVKRHSDSEFGLRNAVAIYSASVWGLTAPELSLITIGDLLDKSGKVQQKWVLPEERSFNSIARLIYTMNKAHLKLLDDYINWLVLKKISITNSGEYRTLDPEARLLINDKFKPFGLFKRKTDTGKINYQPTGINSFFKRIINRSELKGKITYSDFRSSIIIQLKRSGIKNKEIMEYTGIRDYESVRKITASDTITLEKAIQGIYNRI